MSRPQTAADALKAALKFRSDGLPALRRTVNAADQLRQLVGPIAEFSIVIDANILISDMLWILERRRDPAARPALQECILAETIIAYVTPRVVSEVEEWLPIIFARRDSTHGPWLPEWVSYKAMLRIQEPDPDGLRPYEAGVDPDDAPTLALADMISACGILTKDPHIAAMGGKMIPGDFVREARSYSRKAMVSVSVQVGGYYFAIATIEAFQLATVAVKLGIGWFRTLPDAIKAVAMLALILSALHPKTRNTLAAGLKRVAERTHDVLLPAVLQTVLGLIELAAEHAVAPPVLQGKAAAPLSAPADRAVPLGPGAY